MTTCGKPGSGFPSITEYEYSISTNCIYKFIKGMNKDKVCGAINKADCKMCKKHVEASRGELREYIAKKGGVDPLLQTKSASRLVKSEVDTSTESTAVTPSTSTETSTVTTSALIASSEQPPSVASYGKYPPIEIYDAEAFEAFRPDKCMYVKVAGINKGKRCDKYCPQYYKLCSTHGWSAPFELRKHMDDEAEKIAPAHVKVHRISGTPSIRAPSNYDIISSSIPSIPSITSSRRGDSNSIYASLILAYIQSARETQPPRGPSAVQGPGTLQVKPDDPISANQKSLEIDPENDECPICQDKLKVEPFSVKTCKVGGIHAIHNDCFVQWRKSCPQASCYVCNNSA